MENKNMDRKIVTFKETCHGEAYVAFVDGKTELYIFEKFLSWVSNYSSPFASYFGWNKSHKAQILEDFNTSLSLSGSSKFVEYGSTDENIKVLACFYRENKDFLPTNLHRGKRSFSTTVELEIDIPSLHDGNILHEDLAHLHYSMTITDLEDVRFLEDY
mgnify:CR=1 FL=1